VCGLKWSADGVKLASGGNDSQVLVWDMRTLKPMAKFSHQAAVKAIAWSPFQSNILASGGGLSDRQLKIWDVASSKLIEAIDTGSQICNMAYSPTTN
jgi:cell division cycle 20-like protein 1, cofactor of APC complex